MKFLFLILSLILLSPFAAKSQSSPREKLYLHTDKNSYLSGDTLWFKSYITDALTNRPAARSGIVYVELVDANKNVVIRQALHCVYGNSYGQIPIDTNYAAGKYMLRAYTNWMQNFGDSLFFQKEIAITKWRGSRFITASDPQIRVFGDSADVQQLFRITNDAGNPMSFEPVAFFIKNDKGKILQQGILHTNGKGEVTTKYGLTKKQLEQHLSVEVGRDKDEIEATLSLLKKKDLDVQFLPESGHLVAGLMNEVGFKAIGTDGKGVDISGVIKDNTGEEVAKFQPLYKGMGTVSFIPEAGKTYTASLNPSEGGANQSEDLNKLQFPLFGGREAETSGAIIHIVCNNRDAKDTTIRLYILATPDLKGKTYTISGQARGMDIYSAKLQISDSAFATSLPKNIFPTGVCSFLLINDKNQIVNQRAFFVNNEDQLNITLTTPQQSYQPHDSIPVTITVKDKEGNPVMGSFSLAVTDDNQVNKDINKDQTILSYLLLQSDVRGTIEAPGYYFAPSPSEGRGEALDALMLTQGFVQYNWDTAKFKYPAEPQFEVKGRVTNAFNKGVKNASLTLISTDKKYVLVKDTTDNDEGYFTFDNFPHFDSVTFVIQSRRKKGGRMNMGIELQKFVPAPTENAVPNDYQPINLSNELRDVIAQKQIYQAAFTKLHGSSPDVVVTSHKIAGSYNLNGLGNADQVITASEIRQNEDMTLYDLLLKDIKGIKVNTGVITGSDGKPIATPVFGVGNGTAIYFVMDGQGVGTVSSMHSDFLKNYIASDIKGIEVITSVKYLKKYRGLFNYGRQTWPSCDICPDNGPFKIVFIEITTYAGNGPHMKAIPGIVYHHPQPFSYGKIFYSPKYSADDKSDSLPDLRSTIFWSPFVVTGDKTGQVQFYFYSADKPAKYTLWLEGMDLNGDIGVGANKVEIK